MDQNNKFLLVLVIRYWAIMYCIILGASTSWNSFGLDSCCFSHFAEECFAIYLIVFVHGFGKMLNIVIGNMLLSCSWNGIMMLVYTHPVEHFRLCFQNLFNFLFISIFFDNIRRQKLARSMEISLAISYLLFGCLSRGEVASPVILRIVCIREHVVIFGWPSYVLGV